MTVGSLFAGIGGFDLGLERAGFEVRWQVEIDPWARRVLAKHWPHVHRHDDIRTAGAHNLEAVDVLCGGFPCQDISLSGRGGGIDGERSGLWGEYARVIRELRPRYIIVENVSALLFRGAGRVLGDLAALGYDCEWDCLPASAFGAPHRRDRLWIVAYPNSPQCEGGGVPSRIFKTLDNSSGTRRWPSEPEIHRVAHGLPRQVDRLRGIGNAVVPQIPEYIGKRILAHYYERTKNDA